MLRAITWPQLMEWMEYAALEPFGDQRRDWQAASICATVANMAMVTHGSATRFKVQDFMLHFDGATTAVSDKPAKSWQEMRMIAKMTALASQSKRR